MAGEFDTDLALVRASDPFVPESERIADAQNFLNTIADFYGKVKGTSEPDPVTQAMPVNWLGRGTSTSDAIGGGLMLIGGIAIVILVVGALRR
jgi:hypothetical protein